MLPLGKRSVKIADSGAGKGCWRKPMLHCNDADTDLVSGTKVSLHPAGLPLQENGENFINGETQMMTSEEVSASPYCIQWQSIDWKVIEQQYQNFK
jgi:RNA-directed DNA polymerase